MAKKQHPVVKHPEENPFPAVPSWIPEGKDVRWTPPGEVKYSDVFVRFARPLLVDIGDSEEALFRLRITQAMSAWNLTALPEPARPQYLIEAMQTFPEEVKIDFKEEIARMIERKEKRFAQYRWYIASVDIKRHSEGGMMVSVGVVDLDDE